MVDREEGEAGEDKNKKEKTEEKRWFSATGEFILCLVLIPASCQHSRWPPSRCWPHGASGWTGRSRRSCTFSVGEPKHNQMSHVRKGHVTETPRPRPPRGQLTVIHAWHNTGNSLINVHGHMVCICAGAWCHTGTVDSQQTWCNTNCYMSCSLKLRVTARSWANELLYWPWRPRRRVAHTL